MEMDTKTLEILQNGNVISWAKKFGADSIKANGDLKKMGETLGFETSENSIGMVEKSNIKMLVTDSKIVVGTQTLISLSQISEVMKSIGNLDKAVLVIRADKDTPSFIKITKENGKTDLVIIAPKVEEDVKKAKKDDKKPKQPKEQPKVESDDEDEDSEETEE